MKPKLVEHTLSILLVALIFFLLATGIEEKAASRELSHRAAIEPYLRLDFLDLGDPLHRALFKETLGLFHPNTPVRNDSLIEALQAFRQEEFSNPAYKTGGAPRGLTGTNLLRLAPMYLQFIAVYLVVMVLTYRAAQSLAIVRFVRMKQRSAGRGSHQHVSDTRQRRSPASNPVLRLIRFLAGGIAYAVLFAPAYVIAYSTRSGFDTGSYVFMIVLGVVSNGLLINSANKFFTFLVAESRKGYVLTALVKNLQSSYAWGGREGISIWAVVRPRSLFPSHVFRHIYLNARYQYLPSLKEHASFVITGLIIIEMALNIQGHLGYELLQNILYRQFDVVIGIILGIFLVVKASELAVDSWFHHESRKYENKA